ncbi:hypothetical protein Dimus_039239 [Dionaea muscipula]
MEVKDEEQQFIPPPIDHQPSLQFSCLVNESSGSSSQILFIPQVKSDLIPQLGQEFDSLDHVQNFYNVYAKDSGFGIRSHSSRKNRQEEVVRKEFCCFKQGLGVRNTTQSTVRRRGITREGCGAKLAVVKKGDKFVVSQFVEGHNHPFASPTTVHLLRSHRKVSSVKKALAKQLAAANVKPSQQMSISELQSRGLESVVFLQQDLYNVERDMRKSLAEHDADLLYEHFQMEKERNDGFTFAIEKDDEGRITHCFWADATARKSYKYFGDVVVFDTTYNTNRYSLIFVPILGVNHHRQTTLFGCAFLCDETTESFEWLFNVWLRAMPAGPPRMIITDEDPAITKAIGNVLPNTHHRFCMWHITNKFSEKIGALSYKEYYDEFKNCIWNSETSEQFVVGWQQVLKKANLSDNDWLQNLYNIRERWVPAYMKHLFSAHMTSSQRAEISHAFFKKYVSSNNSLLDFVTRFERALSHIRHNETTQDHRDMTERPHLKTMYPMEKTMSELYTHEIFYIFQEELFQNVAYKVTCTLEDEHQCVYTIERKKGSGLRARQVVIDKSSNHVGCSCKMFECDGIPCRHMLAYFNHLFIDDLPNEYILLRWTKLAKAMRVSYDLGMGSREIRDISLLEQRLKLFNLASNVIDEALAFEGGPRLVEEMLCSAQKELFELNKVSGDGDGSSVQVSSIRAHSSKEQLQVRAKGYGKRLKGVKEKATKKARRCNGCGLTGQSHDKWNCPILLNASSQGTRFNYEDNEDEDHNDYDDADE